MGGQALACSGRAEHPAARAHARETRTPHRHARTRSLHTHGSAFRMPPHIRRHPERDQTRPITTTICKCTKANGVANPADQHAKPLLQHPRNPSIWASLTPARLTARAVGRVVPPSAILSVQHVTGPRAPFLPCGGHRNQRPSSAFGVFHVFERAGGWHLRSSACGPACGRPSRGSACRRS